jgi:voltage-gated potassium channel Kch
VALITIAISAYAITYNDFLYNHLEKNLALIERRKFKFDDMKTQHYDMVLFGYKKGGSEFVKVMEQMKKKFIVIDYDPEVVDIMTSKNIDFIYGDATDLELLGEVHLSHAKMVVSTIGDHTTNIFLARWLERVNPGAVFVCVADTAEQASELYEEGVSYAMMPHYIGSEKISSFIKRNGFNKTEFKHFREKHLLYLQTHYT